MPSLPNDSTHKLPNHRHCAVVGDLRDLETPEEQALDYLLTEQTAQSDTSVSADVLRAVRAAFASYQNPKVRALFNASLIGGATAEQLEDVFGISQEETAAYTHLFFDVSVFQHHLHTVGYIGTIPDESERALLQEGYTKGFRAIQFRYAPAPEKISPENVLAQVFEANAREYIKQQAIVSVTHDAAPALRALNKQLMAEAQALDKMGMSARAAAKQKDGELEFVIKSGPVNPTLSELLEKGAEIAH